MAKSKEETPEVEEVVDVTDGVSEPADHSLLDVRRDGPTVSDYSEVEPVATVVLSADEARTYLD